MFTTQFKLLVGSLLLLAGIGMFALTFDIFDKKISNANFLSAESLKQSNEALRQIAMFPTVIPTATPTATVKFVPKTPAKVTPK